MYKIRAMCSVPLRASECLSVCMREREKRLELSVRASVTGLEESKAPDYEASGDRDRGGARRHARRLPSLRKR